MFKNDDVKQRVRRMILDGLKAKAILKQLQPGDGIAQDIYSLANEMRKNGELAPAQGQGSHAVKQAKGSKKKKAKGTDEFTAAAIDEKKRLEENVVRLEKLADKYKDSNVTFSISLEKKITADQEKIQLLQELITE